MKRVSTSIMGNSQKTPLAQSLQKLGQAKAQDATQALGKNLPCSVVEVISPGVVVVKFEVATTPAALPKTKMPVAKPPYVQYPIQVGDVGLAISADVRLGAITGLGGGTPNLQDTVGNLSAMAFLWLGKASETTIDKDALVLYENIVVTPTELSFFAETKQSKKTVLGALSAITDANAKAVLASLITSLASYGLIQNGTT